MHKMRDPNILIFYNQYMDYMGGRGLNYSRSPEKPGLLMKYLQREGLMKYFRVEEGFAPFEKEDFYIAHTRKMVDNFFDKGKTSRILGIKWTPQYALSVRYTNASFYHALRHAVINPSTPCFSGVSGFHHATPTRGALFCAFSGQVIASMKIYREFGLCGAYIDLDGHHGNSIDNSRDFVPDIDKAISPECGNINISLSHGSYIAELEKQLSLLAVEILNNRVHYVVFAHGADSHQDDDLGSQLSTEEWLKCSEMVYGMIHDVETMRGRCIPLAMVAFGGYRSDHFDSVLALHAADLVCCLNTLCGTPVRYRPHIRSRSRAADFEE